MREIVVFGKFGPAVASGPHIEEPDAVYLHFSIVVTAEVKRPAHTLVLIIEGADIHMPVGVADLAGLEAKIGVVRVPSGAHHTDVVGPVSGVEVSLRLLRSGEMHRRTVSCTGAPDDHEGDQPVLDGLDIRFLQVEFLKERLLPVIHLRVGTDGVEPHDGRLQIDTGAVVRIAEGLERRGYELLGIVARFDEAGHRKVLVDRIPPEILPQGIQEQDIVLRTESPVPEAFRETALGGILRLHRDQDIRPAAVENGLRLLRLLRQQRNRGDRHTAVADLTPVAGMDKPVGVCGIQGRLKPLGGQRRPDGIAGRLRQIAVEPVIADGESRGHFRHIQEMGRIPVDEAGGVKHLLLGPCRTGLQPLRPVGIAQEKHSSEHLTGHRVHPRAFDNPFAERKRVDNGTFGHDGIVHTGPRIILPDVGHQGFLFSFP